MNLIDEAIENLPGHWIQNYYFDGQGDACGLGHVKKAAETGKYGDPNWIWHRAFDIMNDTATDILGYPNFAHFNDKAGRTEDEVIELMKIASGRFAEKESDGSLERRRH